MSHAAAGASPRHRVVIVGGGAGGLDRVDADRDIRVSVIEAAPRVQPDGVRLGDGRVLPAERVAWAAGVKAADFLKDIGGLETHRSNQVVVRPTLQTSRDDNIFAIGDCAACAWPQGKPGPGGQAALVPPRAQAANQQASHMAGRIRRRLAGKPLRDYRYRDFGSLVSLGGFSTVGNRMGGLIGGSLMVEGLFARLMWVSLYKMHELALHGPAKVTLDTLARMIVRRTEPHVKLH
jgi:NADH dehydrogenase